ncbi:hypothetical protein DFH08DRAFT_818933 [Mycena albidolilacea]|uniref:Uncharacterized protein n=1 Tax=Mycena albidolilacea TaxID=1033008 RepID=A0AAD6ZFJ1_9AGAR|nr:hypothetical protein DFH08DRAFT_818933 [Mycena albidolilacea]
MTYSERKRVSSAKYYRNKLQSAERVREHKRIQMAQKRAEKKAKRRLSDKPTIKSEPTTGIARARARARRRAEAALTIANDVNATQIESRHVSDAERDASESLVLMSKLHTPKPAIRNISPDIFEHWQDSPRVYEGGNSNSADSEEDEMGVRSTLQYLEGMQEDLHETTGFRMDCQIREGETLPPIHRAVIKYIKKLRLRPFLNAAIACGSVVLLAVPGKGLATAGLFGFDLVGDAVADGVGLGTVESNQRSQNESRKKHPSGYRASSSAGVRGIPRTQRTEAAVVAAVIAAAASAAAASAAAAAAAAAAAVAAEARACTTSAATTAGNLAAHRIVNPAGGEDGENNIPCTSAARRTASMDTTERRATKATNDSSSVAVEALLAVVGLFVVMAVGAK